MAQAANAVPSPIPANKLPESAQSTQLVVNQKHNNTPQTQELATQELATLSNPVSSMLTTFQTFIANQNQLEA